MLQVRGKPHPEDALQRLEAAMRALQARERDGQDDDSRRAEGTRIRKAIDVLEGEFSLSARCLQERGSHLAEGAASAVSWISRSCNMSATSAADRLRVGAELESLH